MIIELNFLLIVYRIKNQFLNENLASRPIIPSITLENKSNSNDSEDEFIYG